MPEFSQYSPGTSYFIPELLDSLHMTINELLENNGLLILLVSNSLLHCYYQLLVSVKLFYFPILFTIWL